MSNQAGFRKGHSTIYQILCITTLNRFMFVKKWRKGLWHELLQEDISVKLVKIVKNVYDTIKSRVFCNELMSDSFPSLMGV